MPVKFRPPPKMRLKASPIKVGKAHQADAYTELEQCIRQVKHYESLVHEWTMKVDDAKQRLSQFYHELVKWRALEPRAREAVNSAKHKDRQAAKDEMAKLRKEMALLEEGIKKLEE